MKSKGFTLIELAVVLAIIAVLAAVLTPMVTGYIDQARLTRAQADVRSIADAVKLYKTDTGFWPIYGSYKLAAADSTTSNQILSGPGNAPLGNALGTPTWNTLLGTTVALNTYLNTNLLSAGVPTNASAMPGKVAYKGPYLPGLDADPWGNAYIVTAPFLVRTDTTDVAYVISAGPNGTIDTQAQQTQPATIGTGFPASDDIISVIK